MNKDTSIFGFILLGETDLSQSSCNYLLLLLLLELLEIEVELVTLKDVTIGTARLTWSRANASQQTTGLELVNNRLLKNSVGVSCGELSLNVTRLLNLLWWGSGGLLVEIDTVVLHVPLSEWSGIDLNNGVLGQHLSTNELRVGGVVNSVQDTGLMSDVLSRPDEVTGIKSDGTELAVATSSSNQVDSLGTDLGVGSWATEFELPLLLVDGTATSGSSKETTCDRKVIEH